MTIQHRQNILERIRYYVLVQIFYYKVYISLRSSILHFYSTWMLQSILNCCRLFLVVLVVGISEDLRQHHKSVWSQAVNCLPIKDPPIFAAQLWRHWMPFRWCATWQQNPHWIKVLPWMDRYWYSSLSFEKPGGLPLLRCWNYWRVSIGYLHEYFI